MLPAVPKTLGRLSDVFASALGAITGVDNRLGLKRARSSLVIVVDGLGYHNLIAAGGHARFLNRQSGTIAKSFSGFPSTTATSLTSFGTGLKPGDHGIVGYKIYDRKSGLAINQLSGWSDEVDPLEWQPNETISQRAIDAGVTSYVIGPKEYSNSGFTKLTMRSAVYVAADETESRLSRALELLAEADSKLIYLYVPELDQNAHAHGVDSQQWRDALELFDTALEKFAAKLSQRKFADVGVLLTADHGVIDVAPTKHFFLDEMKIPNLKSVAGEPRVNFLYLDENLDDDQISNLAASLNATANSLPNGGGLHFATRNEILSAGWYGQSVTSVAQSRMPEIFALAGQSQAIYHRDFTTPRSQQMIGQHGGVSQDEIAVPLFSLGAFAN